MSCGTGSLLGWTARQHESRGRSKRCQWWVSGPGLFASTRAVRFVLRRRGGRRERRAARLPRSAGLGVVMFCRRPRELLRALGLHSHRRRCRSDDILNLPYHDDVDEGVHRYVATCAAGAIREALVICTTSSRKHSSEVVAQNFPRKVRVHLQSAHSKQHTQHEPQHARFGLVRPGANPRQRESNEWCSSISCSHRWRRCKTGTRREFQYIWKSRRCVQRSCVKRQQIHGYEQLGSMTRLLERCASRERELHVSHARARLTQAVALGVRLYKSLREPCHLSRSATSPRNSPADFFKRKVVCSLYFFMSRSMGTLVNLLCCVSFRWPASAWSSARATSAKFLEKSLSTSSMPMIDISAPLELWWTSGAAGC